MKQALPHAAAGLLLSALLLAAPLCTRAEALGQTSRWQVELTPYYLGNMNVSGSTRFKPPQASGGTTYAGQSNQPGFGLRLEAGADNSGWWLDAQRTRLSQDSDAGSLKGRQDTVQLAGAARVVDGPDTFVDLIGGVRYVSVSLEQGLAQDAPKAAGVWGSQRAHWADAVTGVRVQSRLSERGWLTAYGDIGGGGSKRTWQGQVGMDFRVTQGVTVTVGYRVLVLDYNKPELAYDPRIAGGYAGLAIRF
ncbi:hypothetical protein [Massilia horti]|uniref:Uncharacterized protein n=1 Tax=Massilia horti TaxID=2562153 RepID=A0A4Y9SUS4_9BURK|nr:hypothetical protein [Massilia horti]TFW30470.1 hypothetical protein E4O92_16260 [Massilia horti]TFW30611.1 hypothetical protein E4O92_17025 [Massilia horti]